MKKDEKYQKKTVERDRNFVKKESEGFCQGQTLGHEKVWYACDQRAKRGLKRPQRL
jgi:hypothetical protein